MKYIKGDVH
jgi:hypothetical protein